MSSDVSITDYPDDNVYRFSRLLVASRYGGYAQKQKKYIKEIINKVENSDKDVDELKQEIGDLIKRSKANKGGKDTKIYEKTCQMVSEILPRIESEKDLNDLKLASESVLRITEVKDNISEKEDLLEDIVDNTIENDDGSLDKSKAYEALEKVDENGLEINLGEQRNAITSYVEELIEELENEGRDKEEIARIVSGIVQEYERRMGQTRVANAGGDLEIALERIFQRFGLPSTGDPEHDGDLELDNKIEGPDGKIGFSCKRTLRERFRQSLTRESEVDVDEIWYISLMLDDVSENKIQDMKNDGSKIHVPRSSYVWKKYGGKEKFEDVLRPADKLLDDISDFTGCELGSN